MRGHLLDLKEQNIKLSQKTFTYDGSEKAPSIKVVDHGYDYTDEAKISGQTRASEPGTYTFTIKLDPITNIDDDYVVYGQCEKS